MELAESTFGTEGVIERRGCALRYWLRGGPDAPLVMLVHGAGVNHRMWASQMDALAERYRILTFDLRGHGRSRPASEYTFDAIVDDAFALLDLVKAEHVAVVGLSMGGNVAQEMAFLNPTRLAGIACADCTCNTLVPIFDRLLAPVYRVLFEPLLAFSSTKGLVRQIAASSALSDEGRRYLSDATAQYSKKELARIMTTLLAALHHEGRYKVPIPELLCYGEHDRLGNIRRVMPRWRERDPQSELVVIPNASHGSNIDNPAVFNRTVLDWLGRVFAA